MLQEMASSNRDDLSMFFTNAIKLTGDSIDSTKIYRENIPVNETFPELENIFRNLHTIKGNSRIFGLSLISSFVHRPSSMDRSLGRLPVLHDGRIKPMDTLARHHLLQIQGRLRLPNGESPVTWFFSMMTVMDAHSNDASILVEHPKFGFTKTK